jgi:hypothetical protein
MLTVSFPFLSFPFLSVIGHFLTAFEVGHPGLRRVLRATVHCIAPTPATIQQKFKGKQRPELPHCWELPLGAQETQPQITRLLSVPSFPRAPEMMRYRGTDRGTEKLSDRSN